jgi:leucyl aminopeptidase
MRAIAELGIERRVLAVVGAAENMPGSRAYKPGDVITARDGTTVEVTNTDAEGRLVLGDAICWARHLGCAGIVELSTLTGAMVVALGHHFTGLIAKESPLQEAVLASSKRTGDPAWHLPMHDAYKEALKSDCADMVNSGPRWGGSLYAGLFLQHFARDTPFVHLDVAGTAMLSKGQRYFSAKGASGWGVRMLVDLVSTFDPAGA